MKVYIVCGEPSGDLLAAGLIRELKAKGEVSFYGVGGEGMKELGFNSLFEMSELTVMGFFEVVPRLPLILKRIKQVADDIKEIQPDIIITVDSWGFVSSLLKKLDKYKIDIPRLHYVAPQVWAWKKGRAKKVARVVDRLMTLLPNEPAYFEKYGLKCDFVGHPVTENLVNFTEADEVNFANEIGLEGKLPICILPGSRMSEANKLIPTFIGAAQILKKKYPNLFIILPTVEAMETEIFNKFSEQDIPFKIVKGRSSRLKSFKIAKAAIAASGTVSLELSVCKCPHIIAYTFNSVTNFLAKKVVKIKFVNLINILANREIIPEYLLENCRPDLIAEKIDEMISNPQIGSDIMEDAQSSLQKLQLPDKIPSQRCAEIVIEMISNRSANK